MLFDTTFVIDFSRELKGKQVKKAHLFIEKNPDISTYISLITVAEFAEGFKDEAVSEFKIQLNSYTILYSNDETAWIASRIACDLQKKGQMIADNDVWIAATALQHQMPLVTNNQNHFARVPNLEVLVY